MDTRWANSILIISLISLFGLTGCKNQPKSSGGTRPTISSLRPTVPHDGIKVPKAAMGAKAAQVQVVKFDFPIDADMQKLWSLVSTKELSKGQVEAWRANGFRVGVLNPRQKAAFFDAFPQKLGWRELGVDGTDVYTPLPLIRGKGGRTTRGTVTIHQPGKPSIEKSLRPGHWQFLVRCEKSRGNTAKLQLTPHHHEVRRYIKVPDHYQRELDGVIFDQLALSANLQRSQVLVVGLDLSSTKSNKARLNNAAPANGRAGAQPAQPELEDQKTGPTTRSQPGDVGRSKPPTKRVDPVDEQKPASGEPASDPSETRPRIENIEPLPEQPKVTIPDRMGSRLLAGTRTRPIQMLLVIVIQPI